MRVALRYLTADDERMLLEKAERLSAAAGETLLEEGSRRQALFVLVGGIARVERSHLGKGIGYARLTAGALFGEMSFLEGSGASASVVAEEPCEVDVVDGAVVQSLAASVPGLGTRFYQSLAVLLSERLRETAALLPPLLVEEVPQVNRFHARRASRAAADSVPPRLVDTIETFKSSMVVADRGLAGGKIEAGEAAGLVADACQLVHDALRDHVAAEAHLEEQIGAYVFRETFPLFMQSPFVDRSFSKPRGYAGDSETIDMIYRNEPAGVGRLGPLIDAWGLAAAAPVAVRNRRGMMTRTIRERTRRAEGTTRITSLASGPARELFDLFAEDGVDAKAICIDIDPSALEAASAEAETRAVADRFTFARENVIRLSRNRGTTEVEPQDVVYSLGLMDYLPDDLVVGVLNWIHAHLKPGGLSVIGNFDVVNPDKPYMDHVLEWKLIHRSPAQLEELYRRSWFADAEVEVRHEDAGVQLFAFATRPQ